MVLRGLISIPTAPPAHQQQHSTLRNQPLLTWALHGKLGKSISLSWNETNHATAPSWDNSRQRGLCRVSKCTPITRSSPQALPLIKQAVPEPFASDCPLFVFIDPFGATGAPFQSVSEILNSPCSEVLINLDADGIGRNFKAHNDATLTEIFGDTSWKAELRDELPFDVLCRKVLQVYKDRLRTLPGVRYIFEVEMQGTSGTLNYFLVFASKHPLGLIKMKEAMRSIAQNGTYKFADADVGQTALFRFDEPEAYHMKLFEEFNGQAVDYDSRTDDVTAFALNHTPFINAKSMLVLLEKAGMITATASDSKRKRGTFDEKVTAISFHGRVQDGFQF